MTMLADLDLRMKPRDPDASIRMVARCSSAEIARDCLASPGIQFNGHIEDMDGAKLYDAACKMGLEGIVAKRRDLPYRSGRCKTWIKIKNPKAPAALRIVHGTYEDHMYCRRLDGRNCEPLRGKRITLFAPPRTA